MTENTSRTESNEIVVKIFNFGISLYVIALVAQVLQSYSLV